MPKVKIPRKSTIVDMTAMCDVAFLLLSFFILATKQKPPEVLAVQFPNSVSAQAVPDKSILITITKDGKTFLMLGDETKKKDVLEDINTTQGLNLSDAELTKWSKQEFIGVPFNQIKSYINAAAPPPPASLPGIPTDTTNNQMIGWVKSITNAYKGTDQTELQKMLLVKGDNESKYPTFRQIKEAFKANEIFKFRIVTNGQAPPTGSELYLQQKSGQTEQ